MHPISSTNFISPTIAVLCASVYCMGCGDDATTPNSETNFAIENSSRQTESVRDSSTNIGAQLTELAVRQLVDEWERAQNERDFAAYEKLYATRFDGVVHTKEMSQRFVREEWLNLKEKTFSDSVQVTVTDVLVQLFPGIATATFQASHIQEGQDGSVQNQFLVISEDGELRIAREQIGVRPQRENAPPKKKADKLLKDFFLVLEDRYVVFAPADIEKNGALYVNDTTALKRAKKEEVKKRFRKLSKRKFIVGYEDGTTDIMKITDLRVIARYDVHYGALRHWKENSFTEVQMGEALWEMAAEAGSVYLTGILQSARKGALWAKPVGGRAPDIYETRRLDATNEKNIIKRFRRKRRFKSLQQMFSKTSHSGRWIDYEPSVYSRVFKSPKGNRRFATVSATAGRGCGDFYGSIQGFFHFQRGTLFDLGAPESYYQDEFVDTHKVVMAIDIDHDGIPEFIGNNKLIYQIDGDWFVYEIKHPKSNCPC